MTSKVLFTRQYSDESFGQDVDSDIYDIFNMHGYKEIPEDEHGFKSGTFTVSVSWSPDE